MRYNKYLAREELLDYHKSWWWYDDDYDYDDYDFYHYYDYIDIDDNELLNYYLEDKYYIKRRSLYYASKDKIFTKYHIIDMTSIYSKEVKRNKLIEDLLGKNINFTTKPLFSDLIKK